MFDLEALLLRIQHWVQGCNLALTQLYTEGYELTVVVDNDSIIVTKPHGGDNILFSLFYEETEEGVECVSPELGSVFVITGEDQGAKYFGAEVRDVLGSYLFKAFLDSERKS